MMEIQQLIDAVKDEDIDTLRQFAAEHKSQEKDDNEQRTSDLDQISCKGRH